jgi:hypothetical protein
MVRNVGVLVLLEMMSGMREPDRLRHAELLVRRFHRHGAALADESLTPEEERTVEAWVRERGERIARDGFLKSHHLSPSGEFRTERKRFARSLQRALEPVCGGLEARSATEWEHRREVAGWVLDTYVDIGGRQHQLTYGHSLGRRGEDPVLRQVSALTWLGIAGQTHWNLASESDEQSAADAVERLSMHFATAVPQLVAGLDSRTFH